MELVETGASLRVVQRQGRVIAGIINLLIVVC